MDKPETQTAWWAQRWLVWLVVAASLIPLLTTAVPPLDDLPGHLAIYRIELDAARVPALGQVYAWHWQLVGNLGVELLVWPLGKLIGLEPAVRLIVMAIPLLTVTGLLLVAREAHGALPPTAFLALPLSYGFPFQYGFVNYALSAALMLVGLGLWMRLGRLDRRRLRAAIFLPGATLLFVAHSVGWAMLGMTIGAVELADARRRGLDRPQAVATAVRACLPLLPSTLLLATWLGSAAEQQSAGFGDWSQKALYAAGVLWDGWPRLDVGTTALLYGALVAGLLRLRLRVEPRLGLAAVAIFTLFLVMPQRALGSFFADMRIMPYALALALAALAPQRRLGRRARSALAIAGLSLWTVRLAAQTGTYTEIGRQQAPYLAAMDRLPVGARVFAVAGKYCVGDHADARLSHLSNLAVERRAAFVNGVWSISSGQLVQIRKPADRALFYSFSSEFRMPGCSAPLDTMPRVMATLSRGSFDYLWLIDMPPALWPRRRDLRPIWRTNNGILYRIVH